MPANEKPSGPVTSGTRDIVTTDSTGREFPPNPQHPETGSGPDALHPRTPDKGRDADANRDLKGRRTAPLADKNKNNVPDKAEEPRLDKPGSEEEKKPADPETLRPAPPAGPARDPNEWHSVPNVNFALPPRSPAASGGGAPEAGLRDIFTYYYAITEFVHGLQSGLATVKFQTETPYGPKRVTITFSDPPK